MPYMEFIIPIRASPNLLIILSICSLSRGFLCQKYPSRFIQNTYTLSPFMSLTGVTGFSFILYRLRRHAVSLRFSVFKFMFLNSVHQCSLLCISGIEKAACLFGQAAVSALITAIHLVIPWLAQRLPVPDIHLIRSY